MPSRNPASVTVRPGPAPRLPERGERQVDEEPGGAGRGEHRAVDREQDDVGGGHLHRHAEHALGAHDVVPDEARPAEGRRRERAGEVRAEGGVGEEADHHERHHQADRAPRRLQHQHDRERAHHHVEVGGHHGAAEERVPVRHDVGERHDRHHGEQPVQQVRVVRVAVGAGPLRAAPAAVDQERHRQPDPQERRQVLLRRHRVEHPPQAVQRQARADHLHDPQRPAGQVPRRLLGLVLGEQGLLVDGGCLVAVGSCGHQLSSTSRTTVTSSLTSGGSGTGGWPGTCRVRSPSAVAAIASSVNSGW